MRNRCYMTVQRGVNHWAHVRRLKQLWCALVCMTMVTCFWLLTLEMKIPREPGYGPQMRFITIAYPDGSRTGNLMFAYAALVGLATYHNMTPIVPRNFPLRSLFELPMEVGDTSMLLNKLDYEEYGRRSSAYDIGTRHFQYPKEYVLHGYYQSWMYFDNVYNVLHKHFVFIPSIRKRTSAFYEGLVAEYKTNSTVKVGIHARLGDIHLEERLRSYGYTVAPPEYYQKAMAHFRDKYKNVVFIVCSDDMRWSKQNIRGENVVYCPGRDSGVDMSILKECDHVILSVGSFGWWAAWLANGTTVYYGNWPRTNSILEYNVDKKQYFPPTWIPMQ